MRENVRVLTQFSLIWYNKGKNDCCENGYITTHIKHVMCVKKKKPYTQYELFFFRI